MSSLVVAGAKLTGHVKDYLSDVSDILEQCIRDSASTRAFAEIYKVSLSADVALKGLSSNQQKPGLSAARGIVLRIPLLVAVGQSSVAKGELRRLVELVLWTVYFSDHNVEWTEFASKSQSGFGRDKSKPIAYAAHRELKHYLEYSQELVESEPSGLAAKGVAQINDVVRALNAAVHAGELAKTRGVRPPHDRISEQDLRSFTRIHRKTLASVCVLLAAYKRRKFNRLTAVQRAYFDWLVGPQTSKEIRKGPFGLHS